MVAYAVVKTRGRFGADQHYYPLSWVALKYNPSHKAYEADVTLEALRSGPSELDGEAFDWGREVGHVGTYDGLTDEQLVEQAAKRARELGIAGPRLVEDDNKKSR